MKIKVSELQGTALDWAVAKREGDGNVFASQRIAHSDFPFNEFKLYVCRQDDLKVIMLTTEY